MNLDEQLINSVSGWGAKSLAFHPVCFLCHPFPRVVEHPL